MSSILETLVVKLAGNADDYEKTLKDSDQKTDSWAKGLGGKTANLVGGVLGGAALGAAAAVGAIGAAAFDVSSQVNAAAGDMAASLGIPTEEAREFANVAKEVYGNNFADSVTDAAAAVATVAKNLSLAADDPALKTVTENAFRLRDAFGVDVTESVSAAQTLMENFGVTSDEAFTMLAGGYQRGLDRSGDFLDTIGEYSTQFAEGGATAGMFFSTISSGLQGGMLGTDKAADLFKEFRVRIQDGSDLTRDSLLAIGIDADAMAASLADGSMTAMQAFNQVTSGLQKTSDSTTQFQAGVGLLGTQFEDLGASAVFAIDPLTDMWIDNTEALTGLDAQYNTFGDAATGVWRKVVVAVTPLTDALLDMVNAAMPSVMAAFDALMPIIESVVNIITLLVTRDFRGGIFGLAEDDPSINALFVFRDNIAGLWETAKTAFAAIQGVVQTAIDYVSGLFTDKFGPAVEGGTGILEYFKSWIDDNLPRVQAIIEKVLSAIAAFWDEHGDAIMKVVANTFDTIFTVIDTVLKTVMDVITLALQLLTGDWEGAWGTVLGIVERVWETINTVVGNQLGSLQTLWDSFGGTLKTGVETTLTSVKTTWGTFTTFLTSDNETKLATLQTGWDTWMGWLDTKTGGTLTTVGGYWDTFMLNASTVVGGGMQIMSGDWETGLGTISTVTDTIWATINGTFGTQIDAIKTLITDTDWAAVGDAILQGIADGINAGWSWVIDAAEGAAKAALDSAKSWLGISSPSKMAAEEIGVPFAQGVAEGAGRAMADIAGRIDAGLSGLFDNLQGAPAGAAPSMGGGMTLNIYLNGSATEEDGRRVAVGIDDELRSRGLR